MRSAGPKRHDSQSTGRHNPIKHKRKPPKGMYLDQNDLLAMVSGPPSQPETILKALDSELISLKRMVQSNKQLLGQQKQKMESGTDDLKPPEVCFVGVFYTLSCIAVSYYRKLLRNIEK